MSHPKGASSKSSPIPCLGHWVHTADGSDFDCDYAHAGSFGCEDCIVNGGRMDPRTGKRLARRNGGIGMPCRPEDCTKRPALVASLYNKQEKELAQIKEWALISYDEADRVITRLEKSAAKMLSLLRKVLARDDRRIVGKWLDKNLRERISAVCNIPDEKDLAEARKVLAEPAVAKRVRELDRNSR